MTEPGTPYGIFLIYTNLEVVGRRRLILGSYYKDTIVFLVSFFRNNFLK